jgi:signal transduction histidine kinase
VAAQWRIRHKLLLGLCLMLAVMALVIGGSVRALWAYYASIVTARAEQQQLMCAEELRDSVASLISDTSLQHLRRFPDHVGKAMNAPRDRLDKFARSVQDNLDQGKSRDVSLLEWVKALNEDLDEFKSAILKAKPAMNHQGEELVPAEDAAPKMADLPLPTQADPTDPIQTVVKKLDRAARDLRDTINGNLEKSFSATRGHYQTAIWTIVPATAVGLVVLAGGIPFFYAWVLHPIRDLEAGVIRVANGDFSRRIDVRSGDEMEDLAAAFNDMLDRLQELYADLARQVNERSRQLVRSERLASVGFLAAGVAHEINNPLASIAFCSEALEARLGDLLRAARATGRNDDAEVFAKYLKMIQEEAFRCKNITERLLEFSRTGERRREETDLAALVQSVLDLTQHLQNSRGKSLQLIVNTDRVPGGRILARINAEEIKSVVLNLVVNALDSMDEGGKLTIMLSQRDGMAEVKFIDTGCGMTPEVLDNIFEPFFTRSRSGKGTGLGLTISHRIVTQHGGELEAASEGPAHGSTFTVRLPLQPVETPASPAPETPTPRLRRSVETRQAA